jgi:hypothetical protein
LTHLLVAADKTPITEALFKSRFGFGYAEADRILREYLFASIGTPLVLDPVAMPLQDPVVLREAGDLDVSRLKGQLNRLEIDYVREIYPELTAKYIEQARRSLYRAYDLGARDPRLLAEIGLFHCDARDDAAALSFLEAAYDSGIIRPRVNYELARLRLHVLRRRQGDARFSAAELATVLQPLERTFLELPAMADVYDLYGEACLRSDTRATPVQLAAVRRGVAKFPRHGRLILSAALLHASAGQFDEARALVKQGLENPAAGPERKRLLQLQAALPARTN